MGARRDLLLDPRFLLALVLLAVNDRLLKGWLGPGPFGVVTGKLSDVAAMVVGPVLLVALVAADPGRLGRRGRVLALTPPALALVAINLSVGAARAYEGALEAVTGVEHTVVVDPTDLVGLVGLAVGWRVLARPRPIALPADRTATVAIGLLALGVATASSVDGSAQRDRVEVDGDRVVAVSAFSEGDRISDDDGVTWRSVGGATGGVAEERGEPTTELCLEADPRTCVRLVDETTVEESDDGGETWSTGWRIDGGSEGWLEFGQHGFEGGGEPVRLTDLAETPTGAVLVAATTIDPIRRGPDGEWRPTLGELHRFQVFVFLPLVIGVAFLAIGLAAIAASPMRSSSWARTLLVMAGLVLAACGAGMVLGYALLLEVITILVPLAIVPGIVAVAAAALLLLGSAARRTLVRHLAAGVVIVALAAMPHVAWSLGWGSWRPINLLAMVLAIVGTVAMATRLTRIDREGATGPPAPSATV